MSQVESIPNFFFIFVLFHDQDVTLILLLALLEVFSVVTGL